MKYLLILSMLLIVGCTHDTRIEHRANSLARENEDLKSQLDAVNAKLDLCNSYSGGLEISQPDNSKNQTPEPQYEETDVYIIEGVRCYYSVKMECGRAFDHCEDNKIRECMTNVKFEFKTERKLVEQE